MALTVAPFGQLRMSSSYDELGMFFLIYSQSRAFLGQMQQVQGLAYTLDLIAQAHKDIVGCMTPR